MNPHANELGGGMMLPDIEEELTTIQDHSARYAFAARSVRGKRVLDLGCGSGYGSALLLALGQAERVVGCDISATASEAARRHYGAARIHFVRSDGMRLPFADRSFDVIVSFEMIEHVVDARTYVVEAGRVLKTEGILICSTPNRWYAPTDIISPYHVREFSSPELRTMLSGVFRRVELYGQGEYRTSDKARLRVLLMLKRLVQPVRRRTPAVYKSLQHSYSAYARSAACRRTRVRLNRISLTELAGLAGKGDAPFSLGQRAVTPRVLIAVAGKR